MDHEGFDLRHYRAGSRPPPVRVEGLDEQTIRNSARWVTCAEPWSCLNVFTPLVGALGPVVTPRNSST